MGIAPTFMPRFVAVLIPAKDQTARRSDFQQAQWETGAARDHKKSAQQGRATAHFIGLYGSMNQFA
jgi:hypothetical protein